MKDQNKMQKPKFPFKLIVLLSVSIVCVCIVAAGTLAWLKARDSVNNDLRGADLTAAVSEEFTPPAQVTPGTEYTKKVSVTNSRNQSVLVRVMALPQISYTNGSGDVVVLDASTNNVTLNIDTVHWANGGDGYYYYLSSLKPGQTTENLFTGVSLSNSVVSEYDGADFTITVKSETVAISEVSAYRTAWWGGTTPSSAPLSTIDTAYQAVVTTEGAN